MYHIVCQTTGAKPMGQPFAQTRVVAGATARMSASLGKFACVEKQKEGYPLSRQTKEKPLMPRRALKIVAEAGHYLKSIQHEHAFGADTQAAMQQAVAQVLRDRMDNAIDRHLAEIAKRGGADRRNGSYKRHLLTAMGDIELAVPRTRCFSAGAILKAYARRAPQVDQVILASFVLGLSTRKVAKALIPMLGERVSPSTVSRVAKTLDTAVQAFHQRKLQNRYKALMLDGVVLGRKTGAGTIRRPVLVALGILADNRREVIDFRLAVTESETEWRRFLDDLYRRGLTGEGLEVIGVDGGAGLLAALPEIYPAVPVQRCWAHKVRNVTDKVRKADRAAVKRSLRAIYEAKHLRAARRAARRFADRWQAHYPGAVNCLRKDLDDLLTCFYSPDPEWRKVIRTTNAIERRFREVRRRTRPMGVFADRTSMERILFAVFTHENQSQNVPTLFLLTHNS